MNSRKISLASHRNLTALWHMYGRKKENNVKLKLFTKQSVCQVLLLPLFLPGGVSDVNSSRLCRYPAFVSFRSLFGVFQYSIYRYRHSSLSSCGNERSYNWHLSSIVELQANNWCLGGGGGKGASIFQKNANMDDIEGRLVSTDRFLGVLLDM